MNASVMWMANKEFKINWNNLHETFISTAKSGELVVQDHKTAKAATREDNKKTLNEATCFNVMDEVDSPLISTNAQQDADTLFP